MEHIAPLIQTILWVGLIAGILWRYHAPIYGILVALQKRVESGSNIKAGPFELTEYLKPQDASKQMEKTASDIKEILQPVKDGKSDSTDTVYGQTPPEVKALYLQVEDLVLREIQTEYGATISRQVTAGADMGFDGAFVINGRLNIVEVKYVKYLGTLPPIFHGAVKRLSNTIAHYGWRNVQIIYAAVFERAEDIPKGSEQLQELTQNATVPVIIRCYSFSELKMKFGIASQDKV